MKKKVSTRNENICRCKQSKQYENRFSNEQNSQNTRIYKHFIYITKETDSSIFNTFCSPKFVDKYSIIN